MTQRVRRGNLLEHICRYPGCKSHGQVVARVPIPEPVDEESAVSVTESGETTDE
jgi:hypothetical protein